MPPEPMPMHHLPPPRYESKYSPTIASYKTFMSETSEASSNSNSNSGNTSGVLSAESMMSVNEINRLGMKDHNNNTISPTLDVKPSKYEYHPISASSFTTSSSMLSSQASKSGPSRDSQSKYPNSVSSTAFNSNNSNEINSQNNSNSTSSPLLSTSSTSSYASFISTSSTTPSTHPSISSSSTGTTSSTVDNTNTLTSAAATKANTSSAEKLASDKVKLQAPAESTRHVRSSSLTTSKATKGPSSTSTSTSLFPSFPSTTSASKASSSQSSSGDPSTQSASPASTLTSVTGAKVNAKAAAAAALVKEMTERTARASAIIRDEQQHQLSLAQKQLHQQQSSNKYKQQLHQHENEVTGQLVPSQVRQLKLSQQQGTHSDPATPAPSSLQSSQNEVSSNNNNTANPPQKSVLPPIVTPIDELQVPSLFSSQISDSQSIEISQQQQPSKDTVSNPMIQQQQQYRSDISQATASIAAVNTQAISFNGISNCAVFPVPLSSCNLNVWASVRAFATEDLNINPFALLAIPITELLELTLPPVDAACMSPWPKPISHYMKGLGPNGETHGPAAQHIPRETSNNIPDGGEQPMLGQSNLSWGAGGAGSSQEGLGPAPNSTSNQQGLPLMKKQPVGLSMMVQLHQQQQQLQQQQQFQQQQSLQSKTSSYLQLQPQQLLQLQQLQQQRQSSTEADSYPTSNVAVGGQQNPSYSGQGQGQPTGSYGNGLSLYNTSSTSGQNIQHFSPQVVQQSSDNSSSTTSNNNNTTTTNSSLGALKQVFPGVNLSFGQPRSNMNNNNSNLNNNNISSISQSNINYNSTQLLSSSGKNSDNLNNGNNNMVRAMSDRI